MEAGSSGHGPAHDAGLAEALLSSPEERHASAARSTLVNNVSVLKLNSFSGDTEDAGPNLSDSLRESLSIAWQNLCSQPVAVLGSTLESWVPCIRTLRNYSFLDLQGDFIAGMTVGVMLIPQSMAYARIAGLETVYGLYAGLAPSFAYAVFGSSRQLAVGPVALVSLLVSHSLRDYIDPESPDPALKKLYAELAILLSLLVGLIKILFGLLRMGWIVRFLSHPVVSGFTTGAAIIIGLSQVRYWMGLRFPASDRLHVILRNIYVNLGHTHWPEAIMGVAALLFLLIMKHLGKSFKGLHFLRVLGPLAAVIVGTLFAWLTQADVRVIGHIPKGLPGFAPSWNHLEYVQRLALPALVIVGVGCIESVSIAKALAARHHYDLDANQELVGLGLANLIGSVFYAYPAYGSFTRSSVNNDTGARTSMAGVFSAVLVVVVIKYLTHLLYYLPMNILASIVMSSVIGLLDYPEALFLLKVNGKDFLLWMLAFLGTLFFGVETGVVVSVILSLAFVVNESANPHTAVLGRLPGTTVYRNLQQYPDAITTEGVVIVRIDAPIYFANVPFIKDTLRRHESLGSGSEELRFVILEMTPVSSIDSTGCHALVTIYTEYMTRGIQLVLVNPNRVVLETLTRASIPDLIGRQWFFVRVYDAVQVCVAEMKSPRPGSGGSSPGQYSPPPAIAEATVPDLEEGSMSPSALGADFISPYILSQDNASRSAVRHLSIPRPKKRKAELLRTGSFPAPGTSGAPSSPKRHPHSGCLYRGSIF